MKRRHLFIEKVKYIGKEANELEETELLGLGKDAYVEYLSAVTRVGKTD